MKELGLLSDFFFCKEQRNWENIEYSEYWILLQSAFPYLLKPSSSSLLLSKLMNLAIFTMFESMPKKSHLRFQTKNCQLFVYISSIVNCLFTLQLSAICLHLWYNCQLFVYVFTMILFGPFSTTVKLLSTSELFAKIEIQ